MNRESVRRRPNWLVSVVALLGATAAISIAEKPPAAFSVVNIEILDSEDGYPVPGDSIFFTGETVHMRYNIAGFTVSPTERVRLQYRTEFHGPGGKRFALPEGGRIDTELAPQDEDWLPLVRVAATLPLHGESGTYKILLRITDLLSDRKATREVPVFVRGENITTSRSLIVRNLSFTRSEGGEKLPAPAYRPGDTVWANFYITGYEIAEDNSFNVESELEILDQEDEVLYAFEPAGERGSPFYPRRWLPASCRLDLEEGIPLGEYFVRVLVHDRLSDNTYQTKEVFVVR